MASEKARKRRPKLTESASENTQDGRRGPRGRAAVDLPEGFVDVLAAYVAALASAPLSAQTRRTYASKVRQYLAWLAGAEVDGDPLDATDAHDWAVRDYRSYLQTVAKRKPATINNALAAVDDFYVRRGLRAANAKRAEVPHTAPRALGSKAQIRYLRAVQGCESTRDRALALVPFYAGTRIAETVALDVDDVRLSARKGMLRVLGKGQRLREVPIHPQLRIALSEWLVERRDWVGATENPALFLNRRGGRLSVRAAHAVITGVAAARISGLSATVIGSSVCGRFTTARTLWAGSDSRVERTQDRAHGLPARLAVWSLLLYMRANVVERRRAVVSRLLELRAAGRLHSAAIRAAAESLGVGERSVWRWLAVGEYEPGKRMAWRATPAAIEAFYRAGQLAAIS